MYDSLVDAMPTSNEWIGLHDLEIRRQRRKGEESTLSEHDRQKSREWIKWKADELLEDYGELEWDHWHEQPRIFRMCLSVSRRLKRLTKIV